VAPFDFNAFPSAGTDTAAPAPAAAGPAAGPAATPLPATPAAPATFNWDSFPNAQTTSTAATTAPAATPAAAPVTAPVAVPATTPAITPEQPVPDKTHSILKSLADFALHGALVGVAGDTLPESVKSAYQGPGTFWGTNPREKDLPGTENESWLRRKGAIVNELRQKPMLIPDNAIPEQFKKDHPHIAAAEKSASDAIAALSTPDQIAIMAAIGGATEIPAFLEKNLLRSAATAPYAANIAKGARLALHGLGLYFSYDQISSAAKKVPEIYEAIMRANTDKAIELTTSAVINGGIGLIAGADTFKGLHEMVRPEVETGAMKHRDYADLVHKESGTGTRGNSIVDQFADEGRDNVPNAKNREWFTEYAQAGKDRNVLRARQAETKAGPTPTERIADIQSAGKPLEEATKPVAENKITYRVDDNGTRWASSPDAPAEVSVPKNLEGEAADKYAQEKLDLQKQFAASRTPTEATQAPKTIPPEELNTPAAQHALELMAALKDAEEDAAQHIATPEERAKMVEQQDPDRKVSQKEMDSFNRVQKGMAYIAKEAQKRGLLGPDQVLENFVPQEWGFEDAADPTKKRLFGSYHEGQLAGNVAPNKDFFALAADYAGKMFRKFKNYDAVQDLKNGRTNEGMPLAVSGGFIEGQHVSAEGPQSYIIGDDELKRLTSENQLPGLIRSGDVIKNPDGTFTMKADKFVKANNLYEERPIGPTPIPPHVLDEMKANGSLDKLVDKGLIYKDAAGNYINKEQLYARAPLYLHPDTAEHFNGVVRPSIEKPTGFFGKRGKEYDDTSGNMKSLELAWSRFHPFTEAGRAIEAMFDRAGLKLAGKSIIGLAPKIDYTNLDAETEAAIYDGITTGVDPRMIGGSSISEGLAAGDKSWGAQTYRAAEKGLKYGLGKLGVPDEVLDKINLQKFFTDSVFGPQGTITAQKIEMYKDKKPKIAAQMAKDHPDWTPQEVNKYAGRRAADFANNKFGGLNQILIGRTLKDQKILRRLLLAPDFLEATGRSILDLAAPYSADLKANLIKFNLLHLFTTAGINYAIHRNDEDHSVDGAVKASHILDHPFGVVSPDGKTVYGWRTTRFDFMHMLDKPVEFFKGRLNPAAKAIDEVATLRNQYGRKESLGEALKAIPKAFIPIQLQTPLGFGPGTTTEPSAGEQFMKSIGIQAQPNRTAAEQLAIDKVSAKLQGTEARTGSALIRQQLRYNIEDSLRSALNNPDPDAQKDALEKAGNTLKTLVQKQQITNEEAKRIQVDAKHSRLASDFNHMSYNDALDIWDVTTDQEKKDLGIFLKSKYLDWSDKAKKDGYTIRTLTPELQNTMKRFQQAMAQANEVASRPEPQPKPKTEKVEEVKKVEKASAPAAAPFDWNAHPTVSAQPTALYKPGDYTPLIETSAQKYGVDPGLIEAMMRQESAGNPNAVSPKGARGLMQLMPNVAKEYGVTDINNPEQNIDAGVHLMADLLKQYDGDEAKALAAYNAGGEAVEKYGGVPPFAETQEYVKRIQNRPQAER